MKYKKALSTLTVGTVGYFAHNYYRKNWLYLGPNRTQTDDLAVEDKIVVRIWYPYTKDQAGHASLQIGDLYLSFLPKDSVDLLEKDGIVKSCSAILLSLEEDINAEDNRFPDETFEFTYLDRTKMRNDIIKIKHQIMEGEIGYCVSGRKFKGNQECMNCVTAVFRVLTIGGLETLPVLDNLITTPKQLRNIMVLATRSEGKDSSITQSIN